MTEIYTLDEIFGKRIIIKQPRDGYRVSIDPILLQSSIEPNAGDSILDVGAGVGAASLCLAHRCQESRVFGIEIQRINVTLANENIRLNDLQNRVEILQGNLLAPPPRLAAGSFMYVMTNPPYHQSTSFKPPDNLHKNISNFLTDITLEQWIRFCLIMVKHKGHIAMIHSPQYLEQILAFFAGKVGNIKIIPLWKRSGEEAKRVIILGSKGTEGATRILSGLVLHQPNNMYTPEVEEILRHGRGLFDVLKN